MCGYRVVTSHNIRKINMEMLKNLLSNDAFWNFASIITSFIIVKMTLHADKVNNRNNNFIQKRQAEEQRRIDDIHHRESIRIEKELARINIMPFLKLEQNICPYIKDGKLYFKLKITNQGSNAAYEVKVDTSDGENNYGYVYKRDLLETELYYRYVGHLDTDFLQVGNSANFILMLDKCINGENYSPLDKAECGYINFTISFKDAYKNEYCQEYSLNYLGDKNCQLAESKVPVLKEKD